jgi:hypothetical protein
MQKLKKTGNLCFEILINPSLLDVLIYLSTNYKYIKRNKSK